METTSNVGTLSSSVVSSELGTTSEIQAVKTKDQRSIGEIKLANTIETELEDIEFEFLNTTTDGQSNVSPNNELSPHELSYLNTDEILEKLFQESNSGRIRDLKNLLYGLEANERGASDSTNRKVSSSVESSKVEPVVKKGKSDRQPKVSHKRKAENDRFVRKETPKVRVHNTGAARAVDFKDSKNTNRAKNKPSAAVSTKVTASNVKESTSDRVAVIDYSALTSALANTIEKKLESNAENDIKIVIFCNNEPIQSFSVTSNIGPANSSNQSQSQIASDVKQNHLDKVESPVKNVESGSYTKIPSDASEVNGDIAVNGVIDEDDGDESAGNLVIDFDGTADGEIPRTESVESTNVEPEQFTCEDCGKTFKLRRYLTRHIVRCHRQEKKASSANLTPDDSANNNSLKRVNNPVSETYVEEVDIIKVKEEPVSDSESDNVIQNFLEKDKLLDLLYEGITSSDVPADADEVDKLTSQRDGSKLGDSLPVTELGEIEPVYVCEQCGQFYRARKGLKDHYQREHAKELGDEPLYIYIAGNKFQCTICFHNCQSATELLNHTKLHTGELRSPCPVCGKVYSSVHVLRRHIENIHADVRPRPFQCTLCDYAASNKWHLKEHLRRHTGEQPYTCPVCLKSFSHQGTMNRHCKTIHKCDSGINTNKPRVPLSSFLSMIGSDERSHSLSPAKDIPSSARTATATTTGQPTPTSVTATLAVPAEGLAADLKPPYHWALQIEQQQQQQQNSEGVVVSISEGNVVTVKREKED